VCIFHGCLTGFVLCVVSDVTLEVWVGFRGRRGRRGRKDRCKGRKNSERRQNKSAIKSIPSHHTHHTHHAHAQIKRFSRARTILNTFSTPFPQSSCLCGW
jgi:hypothetical protein